MEQGVGGRQGRREDHRSQADQGTVQVCQNIMKYTELILKFI